MGETSGEDEKAKVHTEQNEGVKSTLNYLTFVIKYLFFSQTHDRARSRKSVHDTGKQPVHHQSAEEAIGPFGEGTYLTASLHQGCCSNCNLQYSYNECKARSYRRGI